MSYGLKNLIFDQSCVVEPDTILYFLHDDKASYILVAADYLGGYEKIDLPCDFNYDYYPNMVVKFRAYHRFSYIDGAKKRAKGYIDDDHLWTKTSTGDVCMLFACDEIIINGKPAKFNSDKHLKRKNQPDKEVAGNK